MIQDEVLALEALVTRKCARGIGCEANELEALVVRQWFEAVSSREWFVMWCFLVCGDGVI